MLDHARAAVERTAAHLEDLSQRWRDPRNPGSHQHRLLVEGAVSDLARHQSQLADLYAAMRDSPPGELPVRWRRFFTHYDAYLDEVRDVRARLARDESDDSPR